VSHFTWLSLIPGVADHTATATLVMLVLISLAFLAKRQLSAAADPVVPDGTLTIRNVMEIFVELISGIIRDVLGHRARPFIALYGTFFLFIFTCNLIGLLPGFSPPTSNFNVTFALGVCSFLMYNYYGLSIGGMEYVKHFVGPIWWLGILMVPLELIDNFVRPLSLSLRLFGNMNGDHLVLGIFTDMTYVLIPVAFYILGLLVCLIQAFVFTLLSVVYLSLALPHEDHGHGHGHATGH
jgi:F-type H+-transporting ATPase subunit a